MPDPLSHPSCSSAVYAQASKFKMPQMDEPLPEIDMSRQQSNLIAPKRTLDYF
jgi:hypothetical protein